MNLRCLFSCVAETLTIFQTVQRDVSCPTDIWHHCCLYGALCHVANKSTAGSRYENSGPINVGNLNMKVVKKYCQFYRDDLFILSGGQITSFVASVRGTHLAISGRSTLRCYLIPESCKWITLVWDEFYRYRGNWIENIYVMTLWMQPIVWIFRKRIRVYIQCNIANVMFHCHRPRFWATFNMCFPCLRFKCSQYPSCNSYICFVFVFPRRQRLALFGSPIVELRVI